MQEKPFTFLLSFVSGFVDTAGFIALSGLFTAHVTGNLVLAGATVVRSGSEGITSKLLMLPIFILAVAFTALLSSFLQRGGRKSLAVLLLLEGLLLAVFAGVGYAYQTRYGAALPENAVIVCGSVGVMALAIQNSFMRLSLSKFVPTTVMTGNITQFSIDLAAWLQARLFAKSSLDTEALTLLSERMVRFGWALLGFLLGAVAGAFGVMQYGLLCCCLPAALVLSLAASTSRGQPAA